MTFYEFRQNNSGGSFDHDADAGISVSVIVEADDAQHANYRAQQIGIYFNGCNDNIDCSCCGDRWYEQWSDEEGDEVPSHYGTPLTEKWEKDDERLSIKWIDGPEAYVHYADGTIKPFLT